jgi:GT2 family glycosyltransferase
MSTQSSFNFKFLFDVSVVIVSFNTRDVLRECLESVYREAGTLRIQIIIVDNGSTDGSTKMVEEEFPDVLLIQSETNLGFGGANNLGFQCAEGRYIVLLNSDAFLTPGALQLSVDHMDADPHVGLGGGRLIGRDGSWQPSARMFPSVLTDLIVLSGLAARFPESRFFGYSDRTWANEMEAAEVDWVPGAYSIFRAEALKKVGLFDQRFFLYYEEVDFCKRFKQIGYSIWYWPDITVIHIGGESSRQVTSLDLSKAGAQLTLWRMRSMLLYYRKHHGFGARVAMLTESLWYWLRSHKRRLSINPEQRTSAKTDQRLLDIMARAWHETQGGRVSPAQPW